MGLLTQAGFDPATGLWFQPGPSLPELPAAPTREDARAAVRELESLADAFPLLSVAHRSAFLAALLTPFVALDEPAPLFVLDAPAHGCGPAEAAEGIGLLARGRSMLRLEPTRQFRRQLARLHLPDEGVLLIDGTNELRSALALATAVQELRWADGPRTGGPAQRMTWFARASNCALTPASADLVLPIRFLDTVDEGANPYAAARPARARSPRACPVRPRRAHGPAGLRRGRPPGGADPPVAGLRGLGAAGGVRARLGRPGGSAPRPAGERGRHR